MLSILLTIALQAAAAPPPPELPVSLDRIRERLSRPPLDMPPPRPLGRPLFRVRIDQDVVLDGTPWDEPRPGPSWFRPRTPPEHFDFLRTVTPEDFRSGVLHPCCDVLPAVEAVGGVIKAGIRSIKQRRATREVEEAMRAAGITSVSRR